MRSSRPETVPASGSVPRGPRLARIGVWTALAAGPLALAVALLVPQETTAQAAPAAKADSAAERPAEPGGVAALFVELWLRADAGTPDNAVGVALRSMAPSVELPKRARGAAAPAVRVVPVSAASSADGWTAVVAALTESVPAPEPSGSGGGGAAASPVVRYFAVSGSGGTGGAAVSIGGTPAEVAAPEPGPSVASPFTHPVSSGTALSDSVGEVLRAYLAGGQGSGLERYLSPGVRLSAPSASYVRVEVQDVVADAEAATTKGVPVDGTRAGVRVRVTGEDRAGTRWPLVYRLVVTARAGRWEVSAMDTGATASRPAAGASTASVSGGAR
ncbi:conjugal transfer protein [Streptomyces sp. RerS4]|uniref:conjugal transfer protein n=1 Tax=Streptomyces sp. RerS4 TaxID=2942449 RepID=UPI00201BF6A1|nr:conjugal transfer protein [Streptomyces sp. RerS4]UQW99120.1 conjugal transfer protein [Streptomyces sp. RerS4]